MSWLVMPPLWVVGLLLLSALTIAVALGYAGQTRLQRMADAGSEPPPGGAHLLSAVLGLLATALGAEPHVKKELKSCFIYLLKKKIYSRNF